MATNPQFPPNLPRRGPREVPRLQLLKKKGFPWTLLAILGAAAILAAMIYWLPQTPGASNAPTGANVPAQPTANQVQLSGFHLDAAPVGNAFYLDGQLSNHGTTEITGDQAKRDPWGAHLCGSCPCGLESPVTGTYGHRGYSQPALIQKLYFDLRRSICSPVEFLAKSIYPVFIPLHPTTRQVSQRVLDAFSSKARGVQVQVNLLGQ